MFSILNIKLIIDILSIRLSAKIKILYTNSIVGMIFKNRLHH